MYFSDKWVCLTRHNLSIKLMHFLVRLFPSLPHLLVSSYVSSALAVVCVTGLLSIYLLTTPVEYRSLEDASIGPIRFARYGSPCGYIMNVVHFTILGVVSICQEIMKSGGNEGMNQNLVTYPRETWPGQSHCTQ